MKIIIIKVKLRASWVHSLKEKRMVVKSIVKKLQNKFNISVSEVDEQDIHQSIVIGICGVCIDSTIESVISFVEENTDAEIINIDSNIEVY